MWISQVTILLCSVLLVSILQTEVLPRAGVVPPKSITPAVGGAHVLLSLE